MSTLRHGLRDLRTVGQGLRPCPLWDDAVDKGVERSAER
jgi:hypothetical protein